MDYNKIIDFAMKLIKPIWTPEQYAAHFEEERNLWVRPAVGKSTCGRTTCDDATTFGPTAG